MCIVNHIKKYDLLLESNSKIRVFRKEIPYVTTTWDPIKRQSVKSSGVSDILDIVGRKVILLDINGVNTPFYLSSGAGGKKLVPPGKWYPFFGVGFDGWFNKGTETEILNYYGVPLLKYYGEYLDKTVGDIRTKETAKAATLAFTAKRFEEEAKMNGTYPRHIEAINKDLNPTDNESTNSLIKFKENVEQWKNKLRLAIS